VETPRLSLVAVNGNTLEKSAVKSYLDQVYLPVGVNWQVSETEFNYDIPRDSLDVTGSGMFSRYTSARKRMNAAFMQRADYDPSTLYIFVLQRASLDNTSGDMPRGCQFGYIFTGAITDAAGSGMSKNEIIGRTVAHELGHGTFKLRHTFDSEYRIAKATTDNLMDYSWGRDLVKHQWDAIHAPGLVIGLFERDEDAMSILDEIYQSNILAILNQIRQANKEQRNVLSIQLTTGLSKLDKMTLGRKDYTNVKMSTFGFNPLTDKEPATSIPGERPSYNLKPSELDKTIFMEKNIRYAKYQFHELKAKQGMEHLGVQEASGIARIEITVKESESVDFEEYMYPMDNIFLENITWVSQFDESIFGECTGCWKERVVNGRTIVSNSCCRRASEYILGNTNIANCTDSTIAKNAPYMSVRGRINTATFSDNTSQYTSETYNAAVLNFQNEALTEAVRYVKSELKNGRPVLIGVHYINNNQNAAIPTNSNRATRHFMVIIGMGMEGENEYFRFYDPGRQVVNQTEATSPSNRLIINHQQGNVQGNYNGRQYTLTEVIKHH
jgi:hypothetical protein